MHKYRVKINDQDRERFRTVNVHELSETYTFRN